MDFELLGKRIREERQARGLTQERLAEMVGISTNFMGQIERADRKLSLETLLGICNALKVNPDFILSNPSPQEDGQQAKEALSLFGRLDDKGRRFFVSVLQDYLRTHK